MFTYKYEKASVTVDNVIFGISKPKEAPDWKPVPHNLNVLLINRAEEPFKGKAALPGGFVNMNESLMEAAERELEEETSLKTNFLEQLYTFGDVGRDPRDRVISVAFFALLRTEDCHIEAGSDALPGSAKWYNINDLPALAFDHNKIVDMALKRLRAKIRYAPIGFNLLPPTFTIAEIQMLYEGILQKPLDRSNFRKRILGTEILTEVDKQKNVPYRAAPIYKLNEERYEKILKEELRFNLEV